MFIIGVIHPSPHSGAWHRHPAHGSGIPPVEADLHLGSYLPLMSGSCSTSVKIFFWDSHPTFQHIFSPQGIKITGDLLQALSSPSPTAKQSFSLLLQRVDLQQRGTRAAV